MQDILTCNGFWGLFRLVPLRELDDATERALARHIEACACCTKDLEAVWIAPTEAIQQAIFAEMKKEYGVEPKEAKEFALGIVPQALAERFKRTQN